MKIGIQTWGSDGDILTLLALAGGLRAAGHDVAAVYTSVDNKDYSDLAARMDFSLVKASGRFAVDEETAAKLKHCITREKWPVRHLQVIFDDFYLPAVDAMHAASCALCRENDVVIGHFCVHTLESAAEKTGTPCMTVMLNHSGIPSRYVTPFGLPRLGNWLNPLWWRLVDHILNRGLLKYYNPLRSREGLPPYGSVIRDAWTSKLLTLIGVSPTICRRPPDWPENYQVCGFFNLPVDLTEWTMPAALQKFISHGEPPVYMTFGSMTSLDDAYAKKVLELFKETARRAGCRAIIQTTIAEEGVCGDRPDVYLVHRLPHTYVFPACSAVVHHGGAGTTQAALLAGRPSIVVAHVTDQFFWASELHRLGVGAVPLQRQHFSEKKLATAIRKVLDTPAMAEKAAALGSRMQAEDGVKTAVALIEKKGAADLSRS